MTRPKRGVITDRLRVWWISNPPRKPDYYDVDSPYHAKQLIKAFADVDLLNRSIECNCGGLEIHDGKEWEDWYCQECQEDIDGCECKDEAIRSGK